MKNKEIEEVLNELKRNADKHLEDPLKYTREYKDYVLLSYIRTIKNRNKELYKGFMATHEELTEYATKNEQLENKYNKALEILSDYNMPCEYSKPIIPEEYCDENCEANDEIYKKCWNKYIELILKGDSDV